MKTIPKDVKIEAINSLKLEIKESSDEIINVDNFFHPKSEVMNMNGEQCFNSYLTASMFLNHWDNAKQKVYKILLDYNPLSDLNKFDCESKIPLKSVRLSLIETLEKALNSLVQKQIK